MGYFIKPPLPEPSAKDYYGFSSYSHYNYLRPGLISWLKRQRFETALSLARPYFGSPAIDFGCADGVFLPSLAAYFSEVTGIDASEKLVQRATAVVSLLQLSNCRTVNATGHSIQDLGHSLLSPPKVIFLLEVIDEIGTSPETMYGDKIQFLQQLWGLIAIDGVLILSVPRMTGVLFLLKYLTLRLTGMEVENFSWHDVFAAAAGNTTALQPRWKHGHIGFNERIFEAHLRAVFDFQRYPRLTNIFYAITGLKRNPRSS